MSDAGELRRSFDQRWVEIGLAETLAVPLDSTIRPAETPSATPLPAMPAGSSAWTRPNPSELPRISLSFATAPTSDTQADPRTRADLEVHDVIGEGGMGRVHAARQRSLDRDVAIKTLKNVPVGPGAVAALLREAVITGRLEHPGIVPVHALGLDARGAPVLVMKRVEGVEWRALLEDPRHPHWQSRAGDRATAHLEILMQVCQAVHFAHSRGVVHCDIKPENVMLGEFGEVYLVDWGVAMRLDDPSARSERDGLVGTPAYMAPELVSGNPVSPATDVYLLGATLHHVLTGRYRHDGDTIQEALMSAFVSEPFAYDAKLPGELADLCNRAMLRDPKARPQSALEFRQALADYLRHRGSVTLADEAQGRLRALIDLLAERPPDEVPGDLQRAYQLVTECRFGFAQALKEWNENPAARVGLRTVVLGAVELELRQDHVQSAEALLGELGEVPPELAQRVRDARKRQARARAEGDRLRAMAREMDATVANRERSRGLAALTGASLAMAAFALSQPNPARMKPEGLLTFAVVVIVILALGVGIWRKKLFENSFNRKAVGVIFLAGFSMVASRSIGVILQMPAPLIFTQDLLIFAGITAATAILILRWLFPLVGVYLLCAYGCVRDPASSTMIFSLATVLTAPLSALAVWKHRMAEERERLEAIPESARLE